MRGKSKIYVGTVEEMIVQQDRTGHETKAALVQWEDQGVEDEERLPYAVERLQVGPRGREMEIQGQLVPEQEAQELEGEEVSAARNKKKRKCQLTKGRAAAVTKIRPGRRRGRKGVGEGGRAMERKEVRQDGEGRWQRMKLYTHNDLAALYRADKVSWQQMRLHGRGGVPGDTAAGEGQRGLHADVRQEGARVPAGVGTRGPTIGAQRHKICTRQEGRSESEKGGV